MHRVVWVHLLQQRPALLSAGVVLRVAVALCLSVTSQCSADVSGGIELVFVKETSLAYF